MTTPILHILTGEYPPRAGGVSDYSGLVAAGLSEAGATVHVWTSAGPTPSFAPRGVSVHTTGGRWSRADLERLGAELDAFPSPRRLLVQYTPNSWGYKGLNFGFPRWLKGRRLRGDDVRPMVHEAFYTWSLRDKPIRYILPIAHRLMMRDLLTASTRAYVSTSSYEALLRSQEPRKGRLPIDWLPIPSNIPVIDDPGAVAALRARLAPASSTVLGSFVSGDAGQRRLFSSVLPALLKARPDQAVLLIGRAGAGLAEALGRSHPELADRLIPSGGLDADQLSLHLQAVDLLLQPYAEGLSSRRGTVMAGLAHGVPIVSTVGRLTEPIWAEAGAVALAPARDPLALAPIALALLDDPEARRRLAEAGRSLYDRRFAIGRTVEAFLDAER